MTEDEAVERVKGWERELAGLTDAITNVMLTRRLWEDLKPNLEMQRGEFGQAVGILYGWYVDAVLIGIRRLVDRDPRTNSLAAVLADVREHTPEVTRQVLYRVHQVPWDALDSSSHKCLVDWHLSRIVNEVPDAQDRAAVHEQVGPAPDVLHRDAVQRHLDAIETAAGRIRDVASQYVTHRDRDPKEASFVSNDELEEAIDLIAESYRRWRMLFGGPNVDLSVPHLASTWQRFIDRIKPSASP